MYGVYKDSILSTDASHTISIETKRGCPYSCSYCSYDTGNGRSRLIFDLVKVKREFDYLNKKVKKVNIIDPVFWTKNFDEIINHLIEIEFKPQLTVQSKFELFSRVLNHDLMEKISKLDIVLEFGLQSMSEEVNGNVNRVLDLEMIKRILNTLKEYGVKCELTIIRGLPGETLVSYENMLQVLSSLTISNIIVYPLSILSNTQLISQVEYFKLSTIKELGIMHAVKSYSYTSSDYLEMIELEHKYNSMLTN